MHKPSERSSSGNRMMLPESISQAASELLFDAWTFLCQGAKKVLSPLLPTPEDKLRYICEETGNVSSLVELLNENPTLLSPKSPVFYFTEGRAGYSPLTLAARSGHLGIVCYLIKNDLALPDEMDKRWGATAVHHAARKNSTVTLTFLLEEAGANVSALTNEKFQRASALHWAASHGNIDAAKVLLRNGADVNLQDVSGSTPLHWASFHGQALFVTFLIEMAGADVSIKNNSGWTASDLQKQRGFNSKSTKASLASSGTTQPADAGGGSSSSSNTSSGQSHSTILATSKRLLSFPTPEDEDEDELGLQLQCASVLLPSQAGECLQPLLSPRSPQEDHDQDEVDDFCVIQKPSEGVSESVSGSLGDSASSFIAGISGGIMGGKSSAKAFDKDL